MATIVLQSKEGIGMACDPANLFTWLSYFYSSRIQIMIISKKIQVYLHQKIGKALPIEYLLE